MINLQELLEKFQVVVIPVNVQCTTTQDELKKICDILNIQYFNVEDKLAGELLCLPLGNNYLVLLHLQDIDNLTAYIDIHKALCKLVIMTSQMQFNSVYIPEHLSRYLDKDQEHYLIDSYYKDASKYVNRY